MVEVVAVLVGGGAGCLFAVATWHAVNSVRVPGVRVSASLVVVAGVGVGVVFGMPVLVLALPPAVGIGVVEVEGRRLRERERQRRRGLPAVIDTMIQHLRSGSGLRVVCAEAASTRPEVDEVLFPLVAGLRRHRRLREAVLDLQVEATERGWHDAQLFAATLAALIDRGGPAVPALQRLRLALMGSVEADARAESQAGQARASAAVLAGAPTLFALVVAGADADVGNLYLHEPIGAACVAAALILSHTGWRWMNRELASALGSTGVVGRPRSVSAR